MDTSTDRIERLLVLLLLQSMKGASQKDKVIQLNIAGFSNIEIAEFLDTNPSVVAVSLSQSKKSAKSNKKHK
jgi:DNA-directed RNA polymerase specialized sigma24 family protein